MLRCCLLALAGVLCCLSVATHAEVPAPNTPAARQQAEKLDRLPPVHPHGGIRIDRSGRNQRGHASYYARHFNNRVMANGRRMNPNADIAASKTLPLGTTAKVINLDNGRSATVRVEDRGPFIDGRVVDLSPKVAHDLGIRKKGVAPVVVKPIAVPLPDGQVKLGAGAAKATPEQVQQAASVTRALADTAPGSGAGRR